MSKAQDPFYIVKKEIQEYVFKSSFLLELDWRPSWYAIDDKELENRKRWTTTAPTQQDEEMDELSASFERIGSVGLTIHEELLAQYFGVSGENIRQLGTEMDSTTNLLDFVQKKVAMVPKKASAKVQIMMILFLLLLFIIIFILVFLTYSGGNA